MEQLRSIETYRPQTQQPTAGEGICIDADMLRSLSTLAESQTPATDEAVQNRVSAELGQIKQIHEYYIFLDEPLGRGHFGLVCKARLVAEMDKRHSRSQCKTFACKVLQPETDEQKQWVEKECRILKKLQSPNCISLVKPYLTASNNFYLIVEYCNGCDLRKLLKLRHQFTQTEICLIARQIITGLEHLWALGIIHRDIKLDNILVHFPANSEIERMDKLQKLEFLAKVDLCSVEF